MRLRDAGWWEERSELADRPGAGHRRRVGSDLGRRACWRGRRPRLRPGPRPHLLTTFTRETLGLTGPSATVAAACASGNVALSQARRWVQRGWVDVCLAGGCDRSITPMGMAGFGNLGALSKRNDAPELPPRDRSTATETGSSWAKGAAMFVLESAARARRRGARVYGEVAGVGATSDAYHIVIPSTDTGPCVRVDARGPRRRRRRTRRPRLRQRPRHRARPSATPSRPAPSARSSATPPRQSPSARPRA